MFHSIATRLTRVKFPIAAFAFFAFGVGFTPETHAQIVLYLYESGPDVVMSGGGTMDLSGSTGSASAGFISGMFPSTGTVVINPGTATITRYTFFSMSGPTAFGPGPGSTFTSLSGDAMGISNPTTSNRVFAPVGYSGQTLSMTGTFAGTTLATLGATNGTYTWRWGAGAAESFTINVGVAPPAAVPEPGPAVLTAFAALAGVGSFAARRLRKSRLA